MIQWIGEKFVSSHERFFSSLLNKMRGKSFRRRQVKLEVVSTTALVVNEYPWGKICFLSHENTHICMEGAEKVERRWQKFMFMFHRTQQLTTFSPHSRMTRDMMDLKSSPMISRLSFNNLTPCYELMYRLTSIVWMVWNVK